MENQTKNSNRSLKVILGIAIALLLGTAFYAYSVYNDGKKTEKELTEQKEAVIKDYNNMVAQYDEAINKNKVANDKLVEARERIKGLIDSLQVSENSVKSLWRYKQKYQTLQKELDVLLEENEALKLANTNLTTELDSTKIELEERTKFNDSLLVQNTELATIMDDAAVLSTVGLKGFGVIERSSGKLIPTERARRADKLRVCFTVPTNKLVGAGDKQFYVQVIDPNDNVLGSNTRIAIGEKELFYSLISKFNYENNNLDICEFISARGNDKFEKGRYIINVFNQENLVSTSHFSLK